MAGHRIEVGAAHKPLQGGEEAVGDVDALAGDLVADGNAGKVGNAVEVARLERGNPFDEDTTVGGKAVVNQLFP